MSDIDARFLESVTGAACHGLDAGWGAAAMAAREPFRLIGDRPVWGRDRTFRVGHVRLDLSFDLKRRSVTGTAATTIRPRHDGLREAVFDAVGLEIASVTDGDGNALAWSTGERSLRVNLGRPRRASQPLTIVVSYSATPRRGLYFNQPDEGYPDRPEQVWTQGQAEDSGCYFPCLDFPGEKFTTEAHLTVPPSWFALSNGRLDSVTEDRRRKTKTYHWAQDRPHSAYLVTVAAGEFDEVRAKAGDVPVQYYGAPGTAPALRRTFGRTPDMINFFAEKIGTPYPWAKYATVAVHDFIFGGMENTSATTMTDTLLHDERAHEDVLEQCDSITAHELAHQWFGDLLTCREWSHGWLNESFATYFDALFVEHNRGWDAFRHDIMAKGEAYLQEDTGAYRRPIVENVYHEPIDVFDRHLYERGSVVLDMLRYNLGDDLWWAGIQHYVRKHAEQDVLTHDLQRAFEEATGRNMDGFFAQWVWKGGHPEFKATYAWDAKQRMATVNLTQTQTPDESLTSIYQTPIEIAFMVDGKFDRHTVQVADASHSFVFRLPGEPEFVSIDPAGRVLKTLDFAPGVKQLAARAAKDPEAIGRIDAARALAKAGSAEAVAALRTALLNRDELDFVRAEVAAALGKMKDGAARDALIAGTRETSARVRRAAALALGNFRDEPAAQALTRLLSGNGDRSYYVQMNAAQALGRTLQPSAFETLEGVLGRPAHNDVITVGALTGLGLLRDARAVEPLLAHTQWGVHQNARRAATAALGTLYPYLEGAVQVRVRDRLEELLDDRWLRVQIAATSALEAAGDAKSVPAVTAAAERALDGRVKRVNRVAARHLAERAASGKEAKALRDDLEKLQQENRGLADRLATLEARTTATARARK
ncbi:MAG: hypothetical protein EPO16_05485 [Dehalococcoidia bacterium]|nr:MAG: hypothetical protein EPO16_05485 [Dehalococcoidia bacterium]